MVFPLYPEVEDLFQQLQNRGLPVRMSGSGPTLFVWGFREDAQARAFAQQLRKDGLWAEPVTTEDRGIELIEICN